MAKTYSKHGKKSGKSKGEKEKPRDNEKQANGNQNPLVLHLSLKLKSTVKKAMGSLVSDHGGAGTSVASSGNKCKRLIAEDPPRVLEKIASKEANISSGIRTKPKTIPETLTNCPKVAGPDLGSPDPKPPTSSIHALALALHDSVTLGSGTDVWAKLFVGTGADDQAYISAFDLSQDPDPPADWELTSQIRRGPLGVLPMVQFLIFMFKSHGVDLLPLDGCLGLLVKALGLWFLFLVNASGACLPNNWEVEHQKSDWACSLSPEDEQDSDVESLSNAPLAISSSMYHKAPVLDFTVGSPSNITIPRKPKKILPFDNSSLEYDYGVFSFNQYDPPPLCNVPFAKGPMSNEHIETLAHVVCTFKNHLHLLSAPNQLNHPMHHLKAMLFQISSMNVEKSTSPYNAFIHQYCQQSDVKDNAFTAELTKAYHDMKDSFTGDEEGWKEKCKEIVQTYDLEKVELVSNATQLNEGHIGIMAMLQDQMAKESYSASVLQHNKVIFGTPEARAWFLNILGASTLSMGTSLDSSVEEDHNILHVIFQDFYISMACLHKELDQLKEGQTQSKVQLQNASLRTCDLARTALADEFRNVMASADIGVNSYKLKFPWRTFWCVLYANNICLKNWVNLKESQNALSFNSTLKEDWCLLLCHFKIDGEESENPVLEERIPLGPIRHPLSWLRTPMAYPS
ncbi:hypothetical protein BS47DRAFT_1368652 [Hydnum rufescens UP504]|uniref:Uncharacterized protein n=1 Tax=Hydnum rufescens UP504 TaxID=1448309 RepID=A0A9P6AF79_9AGAM|nr:hypothetical protein BS47DRAFT_1368652 [Hydnum rufescens UP504]